MNEIPVGERSNEVPLTIPMDDELDLASASVSHSNELPAAIDNHVGDEAESRDGPRRYLRRIRTKEDEDKTIICRPTRKIWREPMDEDCVEKSSTCVHTCPICSSIRTGTSSLHQHLASAHQLRLDDVGRWINCAACDVNFTADASWRLHLAKNNCPVTAMTIRWREHKRKEENERDEINEEADLVGLDGRSRPMLRLKKRKSGKTEDEEYMPKEKKDKKMPASKPEETEEEARLRRQHYLLSNRAYMRPRAGWVIVRQSKNHRCAVCGEKSSRLCRDFPTIPSLVWHQRTEHSMQLSQLETWIHCSGCDQDFASLSSIRGHVKEVSNAAAVAWKISPCSMTTTAISWQVEETSEEARRFLAGLDPVPSSSLPGSSSVSPGSKPFHEYEPFGALTIPDTAKLSRLNQRVDKSYILPRAGHVIVRLQQNIVCQMCGERRFANCSSIDHHMRNVHKAGFHQAGMWMHCARCATDFCNMSSTRAHVAYKEGVTDACSWNNIYMCWHKMKIKEENGMLELETEEEKEMQVEGMNSSLLPGSINQFNAVTPLVRFRKPFIPPIEAEKGFVIVKRTTNLPCFGCNVKFRVRRCNIHVGPLTTFIKHMERDHKLDTSDVGAWMECFCGLQFTAVSILKNHISNNALFGCFLGGVSFCWQQRIGGYETETPIYPGAPEGAPGGVQLAIDDDQSTADDVEEDMIGNAFFDVVQLPARGMVKEEEEQQNDDQMKGVWDMASPCGMSVHPPIKDCLEPFKRSEISDNGHPIHSTLDWTGNGVVKEEEIEEIDREMQEKEARMDEMRNLPANEDATPNNKCGMVISSTDNMFHCSPDVMGGVVKAEEGEEMNLLLEGMNGGVNEKGEEGRRRLATFDPTGYEDGDRFVMRKTAKMECRCCGEVRGTPSELAAHLQTSHQEEMRGMRGDWEQQWLECTACRTLFHAAIDHEYHLERAELCSMVDARLCWMEKMER